MNTKRISLISLSVMACALLIACDLRYPEAIEIKPNISGKIPDELKDCKFYELNRLVVVRCPLSTATANYRVGKSDSATVTTESNMEAEKLKAKVAELERLLQEVKSSIGK